nr:transmembrane protein 266 isoform X6 [Microcebus murinus]
MSLAASFNMTNPQTAMGGGASEVEIISQRVEEETKSIAPGQLLPFAYRDLPLAAADLSTAGSQLLVNLGEDDQREGNYTPVTFSENAIFQVLCIESAGHWGKGQASRSNWLKPCCGKRAAMWQVFLLSASLNSFLVACVILVVILLTLELLIDIKLLQFSSAFQFAGVIHWISLVILSVFFSETVLRIVVLGIWDYIENKIEVFDGAVIILSLAPMVASTVANGPRSPWDAISLIIMLRIWRVKRVIDAYVLPVKVEMEMVIQQYEKAKVIQDEQLERLTQICQEQGFEIRQLRAHLAQQDLDLAAEREAALRAPHVLSQPRSRYKVVEAGAWDEETAAGSVVEELLASQEAAVKDDMNSYISQYYNGPSSGSCFSIADVSSLEFGFHSPQILSRSIARLEHDVGDRCILRGHSVSRGLGSGHTSPSRTLKNSSDRETHHETPQTMKSLS